MLVAGWVAGPVSGQAMIFKSSALKGYGFSEPDKMLGPYYIPDRQCSGVVHNLTSACRYVNAVRVSATDAVGYPDISIDGLLERAAVRRRAGPAGCAGRVRVHVVVGCGMSRRVARAAPAVTADASQWPQPQSGRLPPFSPSPFSVDG
ncbi:PREDICTED: uncharacterized protein LOC106113080 [Papilio xuthus]|uniref:Uncharacterized protein LOC106113080 n=1 Tax=Papilio xuthus TaxID=66420 RepID=A0AAJ6YYC7_PAPXU|nr:PREDICTED: uncharacterized protein LOC106113080 [Papilio xuthus]